MRPFLRASADGQSATEKAAVTLTIGLFFDGTGNNALNTRSWLAASDLLREDSEALAEWNAATKLAPASRDKATGSHLCYYTNIHWLHTLYAASLPAEQGAIQQSLYIDGIGTEEGMADNIAAMAFGTGESGIIAKTDKAIAALADLLRGCVMRLPGWQINELRFDLFGFSRGAAAARHFANRVFNQDGALIDAIQRGLEGVAYRGAAAGKTRFIGLFDTVAAVATPGNGMNPNSAHSGKVKLALRPGVADKVFHLTARHECRFNFALNSVKPAWPEVALPGAHSDIGGGYHAIEQEACFLTRPQFATVPLTMADDATGIYRAAQRELAALNDYPAIASYVRNGEVEISTWFDDRMPADHYGMLQKRSGAAVVLRRTVRNDWAKVALRVMIDAAEAAGVVFNDIAQEKRLALPQELHALHEKALALSYAVRYGRETPDFTAAEIDLLAARYLHCSANWNAVETDARGRIVHAVKPLGLASFTNRPDRLWQRTVYDLNGNKIV